jgi:hypothetical protein
MRRAERGANEFVGAARDGCRLRRDDAWDEKGGLATDRIDEHRVCGETLICAGFVGAAAKAGIDAAKPSRQSVAARSLRRRPATIFKTYYRLNELILLTKARNLDDRE